MELGKTGDAATALNMVRERAGIRTLSAVVQQDFDPTAVLEIIRRTIYEV